MNVKDAIAHVRDAVIATAAEVNIWFDKPAAMRAYKPTTGWSIDEVLEHITLTNHYLLLLIEKASIKAKKRYEATGKINDEGNYSARLSRIDTVGVHLSFAWIRPGHMEPKGDVKHEDVRRTMRAQFSRCLEILDALKDGEGALAKTTMTVNDLGKLDVYEYIYFLAMHAKRHITQMKKIENN